MLETISRLETTERTEAYGYLQNCVNVLGVHKLGLNRKVLSIDPSYNFNPAIANLYKHLLISDADVVHLNQKTDAVSSVREVSEEKAVKVKLFSDAAL